MLILLGDADLSTELAAIYSSIQTVLDIRHKYLKISLQRPHDNPKDSLSWKIYPPPPPPAWNAHAQKQPEATGPLDSSMSDATKSFWAGTERTDDLEAGRKPGHDVGEDFRLENCEIPGRDNCVFELDDQGVYQVYETDADKGIKSVFQNIWIRF